MKTALTIASALLHLWTACDLSYLLHESQEELLAEFRASQSRIFVVVCARRWGKTTFCCGLAIEEGLKGGRVLYATQTQKAARQIVEPIMRQLLEDCPEHLRPSFKRQEGRWVFPSGGEITLAGCDGGNHERLRGTECDLAILDEAGFIDDLEYIVKSVVLPQTLTTGGRILMPSTPSRSPSHPFVAKYMLEAEAKGELRRRTIYDAPHLTDRDRAEMIAEQGGPESSDARRESFAEAVVDETYAIVPEFNRRVHVFEADAPRYFHAYTFADFGFSDLTVVGFWEYHFRAGLLYCRDELTFQNTSSAHIAPAVFDKERELWGRAPEERWGDPNAHKSYGAQSRITLQDLSVNHGQDWCAVRRDHLEAGVNALRLACGNNSIAWHPRCTTTIAHLAGGIWNKSRTSFERSGEFGHFDGLAMSMYAERHVDRSRNPYPVLAQGVTEDTHHIPSDLLDGSQGGSLAHELARAFGRTG